MSSRIEDYALIGDCEAAALVARNGSLDWLCWPRFDSDACFAALLGSEDHGHWLIAPRDRAAGGTRRYRPNTLILETRFECSEGAVTLVDFMPLQATRSSVVRLVVGERGRVTMCTKLVLRFGYGAIVPWVTRPRAFGPGGRHFFDQPVQKLAAARRSLRARGDGELLDRLVEEMPPARTLLGCRPALADHAQGAHLLADRRDRRGADRLVAGASGRGEELGLSLLLAARCDAHAAGLDEC